MIGWPLGNAYIRIIVDGRAMRGGFNAQIPVARAGGRACGIAFSTGFQSVLGSLRVLAIPLLIADSIRAMVAFEHKMRQVRINARLLGDEGSENFKKLVDEARRLADTTPYNPEEVADSMNVLSLAGLETNEILDASVHILNMAAAGNVSLATAADMATKAMKMYDLEAKDMEYVSDIMVGTQSRARVEMDQLGDGMLKVGRLARRMGMSFDELAAMMALMGERGHSVLTQADALKNAIMRMAKPTDEVGKQLQDLGLNMQDYIKGGEIQILELMDAFTKLGLTTAEITTLFRQRGAQIVSLFDTISKSGARGVDAVRELAKATRDDAGFAAKAAKEALGSLKNQLKELKSAFDNMVIQLLGPVADAMRTLVNFLKETLRAITEFDKAHDNVLGKIVKVYAMVAGVNLLRGAFVRLSVGILQTLFTWRGLISLLNPFSRLKMILIAITGGIASTIAPSEQWKESLLKIQFIFEKIYGHIKEGALWAFSQMSSYFGIEVGNMAETFQQFYADTVGGFADMVGDMVDWMRVLSVQWKTVRDNMALAMHGVTLGVKIAYHEAMGNKSRARVLRQVEARMHEMRVEGGVKLSTLKNKYKGERQAEFNKWKEDRAKKAAADAAAKAAEDAKKKDPWPRMGGDWEGRERAAAVTVDGLQRAIEKVFDTHFSGFSEFGQKLQEALLDMAKEDREAKMVALAEAAADIQRRQLAAAEETNKKLDGMSTGALTGPE